MKEIRKIGILSLAKIFGLIMAVIGLVLGIFVGFAMFFIASFLGTENNFSPYFGTSLGISGFLIMPLVFGLLGFLFGTLTAFIYNVLASWIGGVKIELSENEK